MRLGEILALRWERVDLDGKVIQFRVALEQTRRTPFASRPRRRGLAAATHCARLFDRSPPCGSTAATNLNCGFEPGMGRLPDDALLFTDLGRQATASLPPCLSASGLLRGEGRAAGCDVPRPEAHPRHPTHRCRRGIVTISKRLGHAKPYITLRIYAHPVKKDDSKAAAAINAALVSTRKGANRVPISPFVLLNTAP